MARYLTADQYIARAHSTTLPTSDTTGGVDTTRIEALLDDASAWCVGQIPGQLIREDGTLVQADQLPEALAPVVMQVCAALAEHWMRPLAKRDARCESTCAAQLQRVVKTLSYLTDEAPTVTVARLRSLPNLPLADNITPDDLLLIWESADGIAADQRFRQLTLQKASEYIDVAHTVGQWRSSPIGTAPEDVVRLDSGWLDTGISVAGFPDESIFVVAGDADEGSVPKETFSETITGEMLRILDPVEDGFGGEDIAIFGKGFGGISGRQVIHIGRSTENSLMVHHTPGSRATGAASVILVRLH